MCEALEEKKKALILKKIEALMSDNLPGECVE